MGLAGRTLERVDKAQQSRRWLAVPIAAGKRFGEDEGGNLAAIVSYYSFFSVFPLLLAFVTILGYVLAGNPSVQHSVENSVLSSFPVIGNQIAGNELHGHALALIIAILLSVYAGLGVTKASANALDHVYRVPKKERAGFIMSKLRGLGLLVSLGGVFILATAASGIVTAGAPGGVGLAVVGFLLSAALNFVLFMLAFKILCAAEPTWREIVPGAVIAGILWAVLQLIGGTYVGHVGKSDSAYGTFGVVLGILAWFHLGAQGTVFATEVNVVLAKKEWPKPLLKPESGDSEAGSEEPEKPEKVAAE